MCDSAASSKDWWQHLTHENISEHFLVQPDCGQHTRASIDDLVNVELCQACGFDNLCPIRSSNLWCISLFCSFSLYWTGWPRVWFRRFVLWGQHLSGSEKDYKVLWCPLPPKKEVKNQSPYICHKYYQVTVQVSWWCAFIHTDICFRLLFQFGIFFH